MLGRRLLVRESESKKKEICDVKMQAKSANINFYNLGFEFVETNTMFVSEYKNGNWDEGKLVPFGLIQMSPAACVLNYGQGIFEGLKALQIEESAKEIGKRVEELRRHLMGYDEYFKKIGVHLGTTVNIYNRAQKELGKIDKDVLKITGKGIESENLILEGPKNEDGADLE